MTEKDQVEHPSHYNKGIEVWDFTTSHNMGFLDGNIVKYISRFRHKNGLQDLYKARQYLDKLIEVEETRIGENLIAQNNESEKGTP